MESEPERVNLIDEGTPLINGKSRYAEVDDVDWFLLFFQSSSPLQSFFLASLFEPFQFITQLIVS